jgi:hypothetical protein
MKKLYIILIVIASSCQRSQFPKTTRHIKNGKVTYVNNYHKERNKTSNAKSHKNHLKETDSQKSISTVATEEKQSIIRSEITGINPVRIQDYENLIASTSNEPAIIMVNENRAISKFESGVAPCPDTLKPDLRSIGAIIDKKAKQVIEFKNGRKETVRIISISHDTLYYQSYLKTGITVSVTIDKIDTVYIIKITEPLGVASTVLPVFGMFPVLGLPFAVLGLILGIISLNRICRNPSYYKRKGVAINGIVWGILGTVISVLLIISSK